MNELRLLFSRAGDASTYHLVPSWGGDASAPQAFTPFLSEDDYADLRWYLEDYMDLPIGGAKVRAERIERSLGEWGKRLFDAIFGSGDHRELWSALLDGDAPRLLTVGTKDLDILRLPWELISDGRGPLTRRGITIRRQLESARRPETYDAGKLPLRILLAVSRPDDATFTDPRHTTRAMLDALAPLGDGVEVDFCQPATLDRLERMLARAERDKRRYHIVHFDGHGTFLPNSQIGALCFEKDENAKGVIETDLVRADRLGQILSAHKIPLAILEACRSGQLGTVAAFRGVAPALLEAGVGSVLSMSHAVHVEATRILLARFYEELAAGMTIGQALEQGRGALIAKPDRWLVRGPDAPTVPLQDWFLPNLYQRGEDLVLVPRKPKRSRKAKTTAPARKAPATGSEPGAFPGTPRYGFVGRARELHQIERRLLKHRAVLLHAMGGMGKTALAREAAFWWTKPTGLFPDGACFVSFEQAGGADRAVQVLGAYFEGAEFEKRPAEDQRRRARELFQEKKVLVVWDNFESVLPQFQEGEAVAPYPEEERAEIYRLFEEWTGDEKGRGRLLVTCRPGDAGLGGVCKVELGGLARADALSLLYEVMQRAGATSYEREGLDALLKVLDMHPLSIELVGPHLAKMGPEEIVRDFEKLLDEFKGEAAEGRNRSLRASVEFSLRRLSKEAREAVRWLGLFRGGVFEAVLLDVSEMEAGVWEKVRGELESTALVRVEREVMVAGKPYLRFHPTLVYAAGDRDVEAEVKGRFVGVYLEVMRAADGALKKSNPRWGMDVLALEEADLRKAVRWALDVGSYDRASALGATLGLFLERSGRLRDLGRWAAWLTCEVRKGGFSKAVADLETDEALALLSQGRPGEAIEKLEGIIRRLNATTEFDASFALALATSNLGCVHHLAGWSQRAIAVLQDAAEQWEALAEKGRSSGESTEVARGNLAATLGNLVNAFQRAGRQNEAMACLGRAIEIARDLGHYRNVAVGLGQSAWLLMEQGRFSEADARYDEALEAARRAGDKALEAASLQSQGILANDTGRLDRATRLYQRALRLFQEMQDDGGITSICNLLGVVEQKSGRLPEARAWHERARKIATFREDRSAVGNAALNLGILYQQEGEAARKRGDEQRAHERFTEGARFIGESLAVELDRQSEPNVARCCSQLAHIQLLLGDLDKAEAHVHRAREIRERLGLKDAFHDYNTLAAIAHARGPGHEAEAAAWEQKRDDLLAELRHRAGGPAIPQQQIQALAQLALTCAQAGLEGHPLGAAEEEALATIATWPAPLNALAPFLRALAAANLPPIPPDLPNELTEALTQVLAAAREARRPA